MNNTFPINPSFICYLSRAYNNKWSDINVNPYSVINHCIESDSTPFKGVLHLTSTLYANYKVFMTIANCINVSMSCPISLSRSLSRHLFIYLLHYSTIPHKSDLNDELITE